MEQKIYSQNNKNAVRATEKKKYIRNRNFIYKSKLGKPCTDCGIIYEPCVLQFDHIKGDKIKDISKMAINSGIERIQNEMNKCEIVCNNCHRQRTHNRSLINSLNKKSKTPTRDKLFSIVNKIKEENPCIKCGKYYHSWQMDFDHRDQLSKIDSITKMIVAQRAIKEIINEISKCDLLCANCHTIRSSAQLNYNKHIIEA